MLNRSLISRMLRDAGRLVHDNQIGLVVERLGDLNHLLHADAQLIHQRARVDVQMKLSE